MRGLRRLFLEQFAQWDRPTKNAFILAMLLLIVMFALIGFGGEALRVPAVLTAALLVLVVQGIVLWGNRHMVTPFTQAQRYYLNGEFERAAAILEAVREDEQAAQNVEVLTLLGNTYRQLSRLEESRAILYEAVNISPQGHFPLYGYGRTLLVMGQYPAAAQVIQKAVEYGAPPTVQLELAEAYYRAGDSEAARAVLQAGTYTTPEPQRALMAQWLRYQLGELETLSPAEVKRGLLGLMAVAHRYTHTVYGAALTEDIQQLQSLSQKG